MTAPTAFRPCPLPPLSSAVLQSPRPTLPALPAAALSWLHYLSVFYYAFEAMITNELNGQLYDFQVGCW